MERSLAAHRLLRKNAADSQHLRVLIKRVCLHQGTRLTLGLAQMDRILLMMNVTVAHVVYGYGLLLRLLLDMTLWKKGRRRRRGSDRRRRRRGGRSRRRDGRSRRRDGRSRRRDGRSRRRTHRVMQGISPLVVVLMPGVVTAANAPWTIQKFHVVIKLLQSLLSLPLHTVCPPSTILFVGYAILGIIC